MNTSSERWIEVSSRPSDYMSDGIPRVGDIVKVDYLTLIETGKAVVIGNKLEDKDVFKAKKIGLTYFISAI